jgi:hypothetical protein
VVLQLYPLAVQGERDGRPTKRERRKGNVSSPSYTTVDTGDDTPSKEESTGMNNPATNTTSEAIAQLSDQSKTTKDNLEPLKPFPTMYWLTHPQLKVLVSQLEVAAFGVELETRLQKEPEALQRMQRAHIAYGQARWELLTTQDKEEMHRRQWTSALDASRGIAGIRNPAAVKCLHTHLAHYLSGDAGSEDNVIGAWVLQAIQEENSKKSGNTT